jgi:hypothetical protein
LKSYWEILALAGRLQGMAEGHPSAVDLTDVEQ